LRLGDARIFSLRVKSRVRAKEMSAISSAEMMIDLSSPAGRRFNTYFRFPSQAENDSSVKAKKPDAALLNTLR
jgi:hypothetical protein